MKTRTHFDRSLTQAFHLTFSEDVDQIAPKKFDKLYKLTGFNEDLIEDHIKLYQGYVDNTNKLLAVLRETQDDIVHGGLIRRLGWEYNGVYLHELYFDNMTDEPDDPELTDVYSVIKRDFGSFENWRKNFTKISLTRGIGWSALCLDRLHGTLINIWIDEHNIGMLANGDIILIEDNFEHAFISQFRLDRDKYINTFLSAVDWETVSERYKDVKLS